MSTLASSQRARAAARSTRPAPAPAPRRLRLVAPARSRAGRTPFVIVVMTVLSLGLLGLIFISTLLQSQSFELARLDGQASDLATQQDALGAKVAALRSPSGLASAAVRLGMVPNTNPVFLRLSDGKIVGKPSPAVRGTNSDMASR